MRRDMDHAWDHEVPGTPVLSCRARDIDEARLIIRDLYGQAALCNPRLTDLHRFDFRLKGTAVGPVTFGMLRFGAETVMHAGGWEGFYALCVPRTGEFEVRQRGEEGYVSPANGCVSMVEPAGCISAHLAPGVEMFQLSFERRAVEAELEEQLGHSVRLPLRFPRGFAPATREGRLLTGLAQLVATEIAHSGPLLRHPAVADRLGGALLTTMLYATPHQYADELSAPVRPAGPRHLRRAVDAMTADPAHPFTAPELARIAGVSLRTLQAAFQEHHDVSPMTYLRQLRLERAHMDLTREQPPGTTVTRIAHRWGFTHPSRFAHHYRQRYGVPPSHHLRQ